MKGYTEAAYGMTLARIATYFLCLSIAKWSLSQPSEVRFTRSDITRDLSHNQVNAFYRDKAGFMWVGTMNGLNRFDGYAYKHYYMIQGDSTSLNDNYIDRLFPYPGGNMLVITRQGGNLYNFSTDRFDQRWRAYQQRIGLPDTLPLKVVEDAVGSYWFIFERIGLYRIKINESRAERIVIAEAGPKTLFTDIALDLNDNMWLISSMGIIYKADPQTLSIKLYTDAISRALNQKVSPGYALYPEVKDQCWVWLRNDPSGALLLKLSTNEITRYIAKTGDPYKLQNNNVTGIMSDPSGYTWITTDPGGLHLVDQRTLQLQYIPNNPEDPYSVSQDAIVSTYKDPQGLIWLGTYKKGLNYFNPNLPRFPLIKHEPTRANSLPYNDVNGFVEDAAGNIWIGTNGGGLLYYDRQKDSYKRYLAGPQSISSNVVVALCIDHAGKLWIGSYYGGLDCFDKGHFTNYRPDPSNPRSLADNNVWEIYEDSKHRLWVGTLRGGVHLYDSVTRDFTHYRGGPNSLQSDYNAATIEDDHGNIWFGTSLGIDILEAATGKFHHIAAVKNKAGALSNENIYTIYQDSKKRIWVGTREGLNLYKPADGSFQAFFKNDGLPDNTIINILEDDKGYLWVSTYNGISQLKITDDGNNVRLSCRNYNELNNLQGRDFNENAALKTRRGEILFGGPNGFNLFMPAAVEPAIPPAQVGFTGFDLFNQPVKAGEAYGGRTILSQSIVNTHEITLAYNQNVFSVEFATLDFAHTEKNRFAWRLDGFNKTWLYTDAGIRKATFTNLDPGNYLLRVRAVYDNGTLSPQEAVLTINILPPWWRTYWAFLGYIVIILLALMAARKFIVRRARARFAIEQERGEAKRMHELDEMKIEFITNISHEFRTPLSLILAPLEKLKRNSRDNEQEKNFSLIQRNVRRLLNLVNQLLDFRKLDVQEHRFVAESGEIILFIHDLCAAFMDIAEKKNIQFKFKSDIEELQMLFDHDKLEKILLNLLSNAYKFTPDGGEVNVCIKLEETKLASLDTNQYLLIEVKDTGIGIATGDLPKIFDRFYRNNIPGNVINPGSGIGLAIVKEFVQLHNGTITATSSPNEGSCFSISLPVRTNAPELISPKKSEPWEEAMNTSSDHAELVNRPGNRPMIMVVEDHEEFRQFLTESLRDYYRVTAFTNGEEAWQFIQTEKPQLVITDVMMPVMNGVELARRIKKNKLTAGIPVLLLTAKNTEEQQVEGLSAGANDYIVKPFSLDVLLQKIKNQLNEQKRKPVPHLTIVSNESPAENLDHRWLQQVLTSVETNISNADFSVKDLAMSVNMSRAGLYKKMLGLAGQSPVEFITKVRIEKAGQLLVQQKLTVAEVAYEVGFTDPKYFAKTFKKETGILPSAFASSRINDVDM